ncbi:MAG: sigma-54-dependent Fis family transcriptional regulator [Deltaproteobacteria bacterium]|nr:sigma-54-dependent Fis family transcriptional regulator [Deltaproteobacteria bacterium]
MSGNPTNKPASRDKPLKETADTSVTYDFGPFIGRSAPMNHVYRLISRINGLKSTVLITGESGTGKELAANSIHSHGPRSSKPFVAINCGAVPADLLENEFFGHARGAFSGADRAKKGLFEEADGGTLFLDEIGELPLHLQVKILRAIQEGEIRRLGESITRKVDLRIITATNRDLQELVRQKRFRRDLYYRVNVIRIDIPPLRARTGDIPLLAGHFLENIAIEYGLGKKKLAPEAMEALVRYHWPGNVRELINVIEHAMIMCDGSMISTRDLPFAAERETEDKIELAIPEDRYDLKGTLKEVTARAEKTLIKRILDQTNQNRTRSAKRLGISRRALISKIQAYGLNSK